VRRGDRRRKRRVRVLAARNGILGALREELIDTTKLTPAQVRGLANTPAAAFGSCRVKLKVARGRRARVRAPCSRCSARTRCAGSSTTAATIPADTALKISQLAESSGYELTCVGVPKTIDNDLAVTDCCPGLRLRRRSTPRCRCAKAALDVAAMADTSTKVFVYEVMGRTPAGSAGGRGLAGEGADEAPHLILFPEVPSTRGLPCAGGRVVRACGYCRGGGAPKGCKRATASSGRERRQRRLPSAPPQWAAPGR
jgi:6-phosphofructokinase 1